MPQNSSGRGLCHGPLSHPVDVDDAVGNVGQQLGRVEAPEGLLRDEQGLPDHRGRVQGRALVRAHIERSSRPKEGEVKRDGTSENVAVHCVPRGRDRG